jgi:hypothetical protein
LKRLRGHLTYANVMATIAVFLVLGGGTAFAATQLGKESVGTNQLKKEAVTPAKLSKASKAALTGPQGATGAQGPKGDTGPMGEPGVQGKPGEEGKAGEREEPGLDGEPGSARAWATISSTGNVKGGVGVVRAERFSTGVYCIYLSSDIDPSSVAALVTAAGTDGLLVGTRPGGCANGADEEGVQVNLREPDWNPVDQEFFFLVP